MTTLKEHRGPGQPPKEIKADHQIQLRVTKARKNAYKRAARPGKLSAWVFEHLDRAAGHVEQG